MCPLELLETSTSGEPSTPVALSTSGGGGVYEVETIAVATLTVAGRQRGASKPIFIPASQRYFWTQAWQRGESESLLDVASGEYEDFDDLADAEAWLHGDGER
jgi:hypothetical protein